MSLGGDEFPEPEPDLASKNEAREKPIVLLVEDEDILAELLARVLTRLNLRVLRAGDGAAALRLLSQASEPVSLAMVDCLLPDMNGCELARALRERSPGLPLVLMSGRDHRAQVNTLADGGPTVFLAKPYGPAQVSHEVNALLSGRA